MKNDTSRSSQRPARSLPAGLLLLGASCLTALSLNGQMVDRTQAPNTSLEGIAKSYTEEIGAGRGDWFTPGSSSYIIMHDPFRAIRRGRQLFQRKFVLSQGVGPLTLNGHGDVNNNLAIGAGLTDSCATCHGRPRGSAGFGGDVATRPDSRDAPHLFGIGLKEMLADEMTRDLRALRTEALAGAKTSHHREERVLVSKGIHFGRIAAEPNGAVDATKVEGVDPDLRVRPFFAHGGKISIREFIVGALNDEMGLQSVDPELAVARAGGSYTTPGGMVLDGKLDQLEAPPAVNATEDPDHDGVANEVPTSVVDYLEFYLLNYFKPATYEETTGTIKGRQVFNQLGCVRCHVPDLTVEHDRRVADVETVFDSQRGIFNGLFATARTLTRVESGGPGAAPVKFPAGGKFVVKNIFTDFKRHDLGARFHERNYDGTTRNLFLTAPLWGVGTSAPYGHDGRSINLPEVILRHGGEASAEAAAFALLADDRRASVIEFLQSLVLFPPDDTASNLYPGNRDDPHFPQSGHGAIRLTGLFNDPGDPE